MDPKLFYNAVKVRFPSLVHKLVSAVVGFLFEENAPKMSLRKYGENMSRVLGAHGDLAKTKFFMMLDANDDGKICEKYLFEFLIKLDDRELYQKIVPDIWTIINHVRKIKKKLGKDDQVKIKLANVRQNINTAI